MTEEYKPRNGEDVELRPMVEPPVPAKEWSNAPGLPPVLLVTSPGESERWSEFAGLLADRCRMLAVEPENKLRLIHAMWAAGETPVLVSEGSRAGALVVEAASLAMGAPRALVLSDYVPEEGNELHRELAIPALIIVGRQSEVESHRQAVDLHEAMRESHLIELENCGSWPAESCPEAYAEAVTWYLDGLGEGHMEYAGPGAGEPVDPKG